MGKTNKNQKGFTLVEIIVATGVACIVGYFASIAINRVVQNAKFQSDIVDMHSALQTVRFDIMRKFEMRVKNGYIPRFPSGLSTTHVDGFFPVFSEQLLEDNLVQTFGNKFQIARATLQGYEQTTYETVCRSMTPELTATLNRIHINNIDSVLESSALADRTAKWKASDIDVADALRCPSGMRPVLRVTTGDWTGPATVSTKSYEIPQANANGGILAAGIYFGLAANREYFFALRIYGTVNNQFVSRSIAVNLPLVDENPYSGNNLPGDFLFYK